MTEDTMTDTETTEDTMTDTAATLATVDHDGWSMTDPADNGYRLSVINYGYGTPDRPFEVAIIHDGHLCYSTPATDDVIGWCTADDVAAIRADVAALPRLDGCGHRRPMTEDDG